MDYSDCLYYRIVHWRPPAMPTVFAGNVLRGVLPTNEACYTHWLPENVDSWCLTCGDHTLWDYSRCSKTGWLHSSTHWSTYRCLLQDTSKTTQVVDCLPINDTRWLQQLWCHLHSCTCQPSDV